MPETVSIDRRIVKTKHALHTSLIELMDERGFDGFTVNDLCESANVNRGTFYNHYHDKEDVLAAVEDQFFKEVSVYSEQLRNVTLLTVTHCLACKKPLPALVDLFAYLRSQGGFLSGVLGVGGDASFGARMRDYVCTGFIESILHEKYRKDPTSFVNYYIIFYASAYLGIITKWVETGMLETDEEMARIAMRLLFIKPGESIKL
jgi:AcrR family transcriptional regulator